MLITGQGGLGKTSAAYGIGHGFQTLIFESSEEQDILGEVFRETVSERLIWDIKKNPHQNKEQ